MQEEKVTHEIGLLFRTFIMYLITSYALGIFLIFVTGMMSISRGQTMQEAHKINSLPSNMILIALINTMLLLFIGYYLGYKVKSRPIYHCAMFGLFVVFFQGISYLLQYGLLLAIISIACSLILMLPAVIGGGYWAHREIQTRSIATKKLEEAEAEEDDFEIEEINGQFKLSYREKEKRE